MKAFSQLIKTKSLNNNPVFRFSYFSNMTLESKTGQTFKASDLIIKETDQRQPLPEWDLNLAFGAQSTDHMLTIDWSAENGWEKPVIQKFGEFSIHPFNSTLHYALECFEGTKAFKKDNGDIRLFRCDSNMFRFKKSCGTVALPDFDGAEFQKCIEELVKIDHMWVPPKRGFSLYMRPTGIAMENSLGVKVPSKARVFCVLSPVGPYYPSGFKPIKLYCDSDRFRAAPFGNGNKKIGGNYGPTIPDATIAAQKGYHQQLWLWKDEICEVGTSNIFFFWINEQGEKELITPGLDQGYILPGVTRDSIIDICKEWGEFKVTERTINMSDITKAVEENRLIEAFGAGTAVIVCPIEGFWYQGKEYQVPIKAEYNAGELTNRILHFIQDIQYGQRDYKNYQKDIKLN